MSQFVDFLGMWKSPIKKQPRPALSSSSSTSVAQLGLAGSTPRLPIWSRQQGAFCSFQNYTNCWRPGLWSWCSHPPLSISLGWGTGHPSLHEWTCRPHLQMSGHRARLSFLSSQPDPRHRVDVCELSWCSTLLSALLKKNALEVSYHVGILLSM